VPQRMDIVYGLLQNLMSCDKLPHFSLLTTRQGGLTIVKSGVYGVGEFGTIPAVALGYTPP
jgi:hypothetical protein